MSIILGMLKEPGAKVEKTELRHLSTSLERYATGVPAIYLDGRIGMGLLPYSSHARSLIETHPFRDAHGNVLCFDGRLDNFRELGSVLGVDAESSPDSMLVLAAFERWGHQCFSRLTGDWALSLWCPRAQKLYLARDHAGTKSLYYSSDGLRMEWATYLDCLIPSREERLSKEYAAAYLSCSPVRDLTPYQDIRAVLPGHTLIFEDGALSQQPHWSPVIRRSIQYRTDSEYDEHFLALFRQAVERRTGPGAPILAQLSGGMDSTSIVCVSDHIRRAAYPDAWTLDTISFFDDSEASLDERRYFSLTEARRGKVGIHLDIAFSKRTFDLPNPEVGSYAVPGADNFAIKQEQLLYEAVWEKGYRAMLSGIGGDEVLGGVPNGRPQLADHLTAGHLVTLFRHAVAWSLPDRSPLLGTLFNTVRYATRLYTHRGSPSSRIPSWLSPQLRESVAWNTRTMNLIPARLDIAPHRLDNALTWWQIMETLPHLFPYLLFRIEYRYPMLDKDLVEFLFSIPPEQLVKPGRRRFLMRRALRGIVPDEILERRRKAFLLHAPMHAIGQAYPKLQRLLSQPIIADMGLVDVEVLQAALQRTANGDATGYQAIFRAIAYELWLKSRLASSRAEAASEQRQYQASLAVP